ncbi:SWIM zinc finger family protein [Fredinandcohnia sp. 179-A 10B2 NHS]|uniref:SWIM zinc finger family protein n=1 Tax=Fredinandcohnia sp. 179-A 10B2 NHS TaxID=3235176 RepID=UPI00399F7124
MLQNDISKEQVLHFSEKLRSTVTYDTEEDRNLIKKGLNLYRQGSVYNVKFNGQVVEGRVQDVTPVDVTLDLALLEMSSCSCPSTDFCRHRMALFFYIYASVDRVGSLLDLWKEGNKSKPSVLDSMKAAAKQKELRKDYQDDSLVSWISFFNREYERFSAGCPEKSQYYFATIFHTFFQTLKRKAPFSQELKRLFHIHAALFCVRKTYEALDNLELKQYQIETYVRPYFHNFTDVVLDNCMEMKQVSLPFSMDKLLADSIEPFRNTLLQNTGFQFERMQMYRLLWATLLNRKEWREVEEQYLEQKNDRDHLTFEDMVALAHLRFLQKEDETAMDVMTQLGVQGTPHSFWWISYLSEQKAWERVHKWVQFVAPHLASYIFDIPSYDGRRHLTRSFLKNISQYALEYDDSLYTEVMKQLLPYSYVEYNDFLLDKEEYRKWIELQMLVGYDLDDCDRYILKTIEENDRGALLPFYHQAIIQAVEAKNRSSYKKAVKYLRKIRTHYRRLKKEDIWDDYISKLAAANKRLRAFQEELLRASLVKE